MSCFRAYSNKLYACTTKLEGYLFKLYKIHIVPCRYVVPYFKHYSVFSVSNTHFIIYTIFKQLIKNIEICDAIFRKGFYFEPISCVRLAAI